MKICHVISGLDGGGAERFLLRLLSHSPHSYECTVVSLKAGGKLVGDFKRLGFRVIELRFNQPIYIVSSLIDLWCIFRRGHFSIVHTWMYHADLVGGVLAKLFSNAKVIWCVRTTNVQRSGNRLTILIMILNRYLSGWVPSKIIYASNSARMSHEKIGYSRVKGEVVHNGFEVVGHAFPKPFGPLLRKFRFKKLKFVLSVGRFNPSKDHFGILRAFAKFSVRRFDYRLVLIGAGVDRTNSLLFDYARQLGIVDYVYFLGERDDVFMWMAECDIFCCHSINEAFPNVLVEAMLQGAVCITTDVGDAREIIMQRELVCPPGNASELSLRLTYAADMKIKEKDFIKLNNYRFALKRFSMIKTVAKYNDIYSNILF